jgi:hypothetical protein
MEERREIAAAVSLPLEGRCGHGPTLVAIPSDRGKLC